MLSFTSATLIFPLFIEVCAAICCYNHNPLCVLSESITCTPNCADGASQCNLSTQVCAEDHFGGCVDIITMTVTTTIIDYQIYSTVTEYTVTSDETVATTINTITQTSESVYEVTSLSKRNVLYPLDILTASEPAPTSTLPHGHRPMELLKRVQTPTTTITVTTTSTDLDYCSTANVPICTSTISTLLINEVTASAAVTTTLLNGITSVVTAESTGHTATSQTGTATTSPTSSGAESIVSQCGLCGQWALLLSMLGFAFLSG